MIGSHSSIARRFSTSMYIEAALFWFPKTTEKLTALLGLLKSTVNMDIKYTSALSCQQFNRPASIAILHPISSNVIHNFINTIHYQELEMFRRSTPVCNRRQRKESN